MSEKTNDMYSAVKIDDQELIKTCIKMIEEKLKELDSIDWHCSEIKNYRIISENFVELKINACSIDSCRTLNGIYINISTKEIIFPKPRISAWT